MRKCIRCAESSMLRKRQCTERGNHTTHTRRWRQRSWSPVLDLVVVNAQESGHWGWMMSCGWMSRRV
ncbi:hypothetical protein BGY98DRAFT_1022961, partial [Russula aff. rugulosa BPL654]